MTNHATFPAVSGNGAYGVTRHVHTPQRHLTEFKRDLLINRRTNLLQRAECLRAGRMSYQEQGSYERRLIGVARRLKLFIAQCDGSEWMEKYRQIWADYALNKIDHSDAADRMRWLGWDTTPASLLTELAQKDELNVLDNPPVQVAAQ